MKILLVTSVYKNEVVGPARFARLLESSDLMDVHILTSNVEETPTLKSVNIHYAWWQKKLKIFFSIKPFTQRVLALKDEYDVLIYNSSVLVDADKIDSPYVVMVNDEKLANLKFTFNFDFLRRSLHRRIEKKAVRNASKVIVNSRYLKEKIASAYSIDSDNMYVLHKGISLENKKADFQDKLCVDGTINILFVKNDFKIGGLPELISALGLLEKYAFTLTIIGTSGEVRDSLRNYKNVQYNILGYQMNDLVVKAMYDHDILCMPARYEPLGVAIMEGLAVGIPTITTGVGGLPEVTVNGKYVWQCEPNDPKSIAEQIEACILNPKARREKSIEGKKNVHQRFDFKHVEETLNHLISNDHTTSWH